MADNSLTHLVDSTHGGNILDLVLSNRNCVLLVNVIENLPSTDHFAIEFFLCNHSCLTSFVREPCMFTKRTDFNAFCKVLSHIPGML